jgi:predicted  nucleic acid-binding Zn-ribbon protein
MNLRCSNCGIIWEISVNADTSNVSNHCPQCGGFRHPIEDTKQEIKQALSARDIEWREKIEVIVKALEARLDISFSGYYKVDAQSIITALNKLLTQMEANND